MIDFSIKKIPDDLHRAIRVKAAQAGVSMTKYIISLLAKDVKDNEKPRQGKGIHD